MTAVVISQPMLFPWPGFFEQMKLADVYLWLDDAQFSKGGFTNRVQVRHGGVQKWLSIPLAGKGSFQEIRALESAEDFRPKHLSFLKQALADAPFARDAIAIVEEVYDVQDLCELLIRSAEVPARRLGLPVAREPAKRTSDLTVEGTSWRRVLDLVRAVGGTRYITGHGAARYMDHAAFEAEGISVDYMDYSKTAWPQHGGGAFTPYVSILDLIANTGPEAATYLRPATLGWRAFLERQAREATYA